MLYILLRGMCSARCYTEMHIHTHNKTHNKMCKCVHKCMHTYTTKCVHMYICICIYVYVAKTCKHTAVSYIIHTVASNMPFITLVKM